MADEQLEQLQLSRDRVQAAYRFREAYAQMCMQGVETSDLPFGKPDVAAQTPDLQRIWDLRVEASSSFTEAGQWAMLIEPAYALDLFRRAGYLYRELEFGFGYYLSILTQDRSEKSRNATDLITTIGRRLRALVSHAADLPEPLRHPQQQAYLLLAAAAIPRGARTTELSESVFQLLETSPHRFGAIPVGALSTPINSLWRAASCLARGEYTDLLELVAIVTSMARRYDESVQLAMVNDYLWHNAAASVDVGDIDIATVTLAAFSAIGFDLSIDEIDNAFRHAAAESGRYARAQIEIALNVAHAGYSEG